MNKQPGKLIVQKYGGATLADPAKIKEVAKRIAAYAREGTQLIAVVSAMGKTTNSLIDLANQVSNNPHLRELDMLLTVGERISMSLVSMALNDLGCQAISFTGSQAGIFTDHSHVNAFIRDLKPIRVQEALDKNKVVILAGFQGVSPETKEITTLGRGGSDTSAVAMAAYFKADRCEILKDVPAVFTADPHLVLNAKILQELNYDQLMEMTFWGAKVLHYRSVELAKQKNVTLYIGPASNITEDGTIVKKGLNMFESSRILSLNSHETVLQIICDQSSIAEALKVFQKNLEQCQIAFPQILHTESQGRSHRILLTGPQEITTVLKSKIKNFKNTSLQPADFSTITATCTGVTSPQIIQSTIESLEKQNITVHQTIISAMSTSVLIDSKHRETALKILHNLI